MKIIGLAGTNGSGKDTIAELLRDEYGWLFADATAMFVEELTKRGLPTDRLHKSELSAEWRREYGMAAIVDRAVKMFEAGDYKGLIGGAVIWVDADSRVRYDRITSNNRGRIEDNKTFEEFQADQAREMTPTGDGATLNIAAVKERADISLENNSSDIEAFRTYAKKALADYIV